MHLTHAVNLLSVEEDALRGGCFASIYVSNDTNISSFFEWEFSRHVHNIGPDLSCPPLSPAIMSEGFVRLRHLVGLLAFFNRISLSCGGIHQFAGKFLGHRF